MPLTASCRHARMQFAAPRSIYVLSCRVDRGNFTPSRSQIPDVRLSPHPARATERRPPPSVEKRGLFLLPVGPLPTLVTCSLCSTGITPLPCYYGAVRPCPPHRYFRPRRFAACTFSLGIVG